jgi:sporulation protein YlmC with PRC-barrel domain
MKQGQVIRIYSELRDLEIFDSEGELCGIADEIELDGDPLAVTAILVGPGAYGPRLPTPLRTLVRWIAGDGCVRVPWNAVEHVTSRISLNRPAETLGLTRVERKLAPLLHKVPAL